MKRLPLGVDPAMEAPVKAWTEELEKYAGQMSGIDMNVCASVLMAQASVFAWRGHLSHLDQLEKYEAKKAKLTERRSELVASIKEKETLQAQLASSQELLAEMTKAAQLDRQRVANLAMEVGQLRAELDAAKIARVDEVAVVHKYKASAECKYESVLGYLFAFIDVIDVARKEKLDDRPLMAALAGYIEKQPPPAYYLGLMSDLSGYLPPGSEHLLVPAPSIQLMSDPDYDMTPDYYMTPDYDMAGAADADQGEKNDVGAAPAKATVVGTIDVCT